MVNGIDDLHGRYRSMEGLYHLGTVKQLSQSPECLVTLCATKATALLVHYLAAFNPVAEGVIACRPREYCAREDDFDVEI